MTSPSDDATASDAARNFVKRLCRGAAVVAISPMLASFYVRARLMGANRALEGSTQMLAWMPGVLGQYLRRAFLAHTVEYCAPTATISYGTLLADVGARFEAFCYVGPGCHLGRVHVGRDALLGAGVHVPSGPHIHGTARLDVPIRMQPGDHRTVQIGAGAWIGSSAVVMADVGADTVVGAGAVVVRPLPARVIAGGVPATVLRVREPQSSDCEEQRRPVS